jgi:adenylate cyclase
MQSLTERYNLDQAILARNVQAFREEERKGLMIAALIRALIVGLILIWVASATFYTGAALAWLVGLVLVFIILALAQFELLRRNLAPPWLKYLFLSLEAAWLAVILAAPNPFSSLQVPPALLVRGSEFLYFLVLLVPAMFCYAPRFAIWSGAWIAIAWATVVGWVASRAGVVTRSDLPEELSGEAHLRWMQHPDYVSFDKAETEVIVGSLLAIAVAVAITRSRRLIARRSAAERARGNLARYFSPNVVDVLAARDQPLGDVRKQQVASLFADVRGFTSIAEALSPEDVMALLRELHRRAAEIVFEHGGTLEKYIGDAMLATFGVPEPAADDPARALACARALLLAIERWNRERLEAGYWPVRIGIGLHCGPAVLGDIGSARSMSFAVIGDSVNVASRLEALTRDLEVDLIVSHELFEAARMVPNAGPELFAGFEDTGSVQVKGRVQPVHIHTLRLDADAVAA